MGKFKKAVSGNHISLMVSDHISRLHEKHNYFQVINRKLVVTLLNNEKLDDISEYI